MRDVIKINKFPTTCVAQEPNEDPIDNRKTRFSAWILGQLDIKPTKQQHHQIIFRLNTIPWQSNFVAGVFRELRDHQVRKQTACRGLYRFCLCLLRCNWTSFHLWKYRNKPWWWWIRHVIPSQSNCHTRHQTENNIWITKCEPFQARERLKFFLAMDFEREQRAQLALLGTLSSRINVQKGNLGIN